MSPNLSEFFRDKAKNELGEDENRRHQALERFNEWINKHPYILNHRIDDIHALAFLRAKKYNIEKTFKSVEKILTFKVSHPEIFDYNEVNYRRFCEIFDSGFIIPLKKRDADGSKIVLCRLKKLNSEKISPDDVIRVQFVFGFLLAFEEETQIAGVNFIYDITDVPLLTAEKYLLSGFIKTGSLAKYISFRIKSIFIIGLPRSAVKIANVIKNLLSEKLRQRLNFVHSIKDLFKYFDKSLLNDILVDDSEEINNIKNSLIINIERIREFFNYEIDIENLKMTEDGTNIGNFRMLTID